MYGIDSFWSRNPALLFGLSALIGFYASIDFSLGLWIAIFFLLFPLIFSRRLFYTILIMSAVFFYGTLSIRMPQLPEDGLQGVLYFDIASLELQQTHFGFQWIYKGHGERFIPSGDATLNAKHFPCLLSLSKNDKITRPPADRAYLVHGTLKQNRKGDFRFYVNKEIPWEGISKSWSLAEIRFQAKERVKSWIKQRIPELRISEFLSGIITGEFEDKVMRGEFGRLGLQHIMAISGFHFGIVAFLLHFVMRLFLPAKGVTFILIILLSIYFIFLGCSPSIVRAWVMALVAIVSGIFEKPSLSLNSLGIALLAILCFDPTLTLSIGFQFSVIATAAILLWYPIVEGATRRLWPKRTLGQIIKMHFLDQHAYFVLSTFRQAIALGCAVNMAALPATLFFFHKFPLISLVYNLFIPFLVSISMFLFLVGGFFDLVLPGLGSFFHISNAWLTHFMLNSIYQFPISFSYYVRISFFPLALLIAILCLVFLMGMRIQKRRDSLI